MYAASISGWLKGRGHRVAMLTLTGSPIADEVGKRGVEVTGTSRAGYLLPSAVWAVVTCIGRYRPDIIHAHLSRDLWVIAMGRAVSYRVPVVFSQQMASSYPKRDVLHRWVWSGVSQVGALTEEIRVKTASSTAIPEHRIAVLPYGVDTDELAPKAGLGESLRQRYGIGVRDFVVGIVGRLDPGKGQHVFLEALWRLEHEKGIMGVLVGEETHGEPGYRQVLQDQVQRFGLGDRVRFLGYISDPKDIYPMLDVLVLPSRKETFGLVLIEAMGFGLPVVATEAGGVPEIVVDGVTGILVPPDDPVTLAGAIDKLVADRDMCRDMGQKGRERAIEKYRLSDHLDRLESLFAQAVSEVHGTG
jgi:glycosyltransferase involved in cell wall biosynthesis